MPDFDLPLSIARCCNRLSCVFADAHCERVAGTVVSAAVMTDVPPMVKWTAAVIAGGGVAGLTQGATAILRAKSTVLTGGIGNWVIVGEIRRIIRTPEVAARTIDAFRQETPNVDEQAIVSALGNFDELWAALFPSEQARLVRLLVERVTIGTEGIAVDLRNDGVAAIVRDMITPLKEQALA